MRLPSLQRHRVCLCGFAILACATGCGRPTLTIHTAEILNAWNGDNTASALDVDVVLLTPADSRAHPELVRRKLRSDEWFRLRDAGTPPLDLPPDRILALRGGPERPGSDTLVGGALLSGRDRPGGNQPIVIAIPHPAPYDEESAIVIFGRYSTQTGVASSPPLVIQPLPGRFEEQNISIRAERRQLSRRY